jgi:hypothetical protein
LALPYAVEHLRAALTTLANTDAPLADRLQAAWTSHVQELWQTMCLPTDLNERFRAMWREYTVRDDADRHTSTLRPLTTEELQKMAADVVALAVDTIAADARGDDPAPAPT